MKWKPPKKSLKRPAVWDLCRDITNGPSNGLVTEGEKDMRKEHLLCGIIMVLMIGCLTGCATRPRTLPPMPEVNLDTQDPTAYLKLSQESLRKAFAEKKSGIDLLKTLNMAVAAAEKANELNPEMADAYYFLGYSKGLKGMLIRNGVLMQEGIENYKRALQLKPVFAGPGYYPPLQYAIVKIRNSAKDNRLTEYESFKLLKEAIQIYPEFAPAHFELAKVYKDRGKDELALQGAKTAAELSPNNWEAQKLLGLSYEYYIKEKNQTLYLTAAKKGIEALKKAVQLNPNDPEAHEAIGRYYGVLGINELKAFEITTAINQKKTSSNLIEMGHTYLAQGDIEKAIASYRQVSQTAKEPADGVDHLIGLCNYLNNNYTQACEDFRIYFIAHLYPDIQPVLWHYCSLLGAEQQRKAQKVLMEFSETFHGGDWESALLDFHLKRISESELLEKAAQNFDKCEAYYYIGCQYLHQKDQKLAAEYFKKAVQTKIYHCFDYSAARIRLAEISK